MQIDLTEIVIVTAICITGVILGINWLKSGKFALVPLKKELSYWKEYAEEMEDEVKYLTGKLKQKDTPPMVKGDLNKDNLSEIITSFLPMFADKVPQYLQPFFKNPVIQKFVIDYAVKNPEQAMSLFGRFFNKNLGKPGGNGQQQEATQELPAGEYH